MALICIQTVIRSDELVRFIIFFKEINRVEGLKAPLRLH